MVPRDRHARVSDKSLPDGKHPPARDDCTVEGLQRALRVMGGKWKPLILWHLRAGPLRFAALRRGIPGISEKMLAQHLRQLEADGMNSRTATGVAPQKVEYAMTLLGARLDPALRALSEWGQASRRD